MKKNDTGILDAFFRHEDAMATSRRVFLKTLVLGAAAAAVPAIFPGAASAAQTGGERVLIVYFSHSGNTRRLAGFIHDRVGGRMIELKTAKPYPEDYDAVVDEAKKEQEADARPEITTALDGLDQVDTVFIGYPNWWGTLPMPFFTLLERYSLAGKNVVPFCTHEGSRFGRSERDLKALCPQARLLKGFEVRGSRVSGAEKAVDEWLTGLGLTANR